MNITFLPGSIVGYLGYPEALFVRSLALGLARANHAVRVVEERRNVLVTETLERAGAGAYRHFHGEFTEFQHHTFEPRTGPRLLEWVSREMALSDVIVAVNGIPRELCRWIANLEQPGSLRLFLTYRPRQLDSEKYAAYEIDRFEGILASGPIAAGNRCFTIHASVAGADRELYDDTAGEESVSVELATSETVAREFLNAVASLQPGRFLSAADRPNGATPGHRAILETGAEPSDGA